MNEATGAIVLLIFAAIFVAYIVWIIERRNKRPGSARGSNDSGSGGSFWFLGGGDSGCDSGAGGGGDGGGD